MAHIRCKKDHLTHFLSSIKKNNEVSSDLFVWGVIKNNACIQVAVSSTLGSPVQMHRHMDTGEPHTPALMKGASANTFYLPFSTD